MTALYAPFLKLLPDNAPILDVGCGSGRDSLYFFQNGYIVTAIDGSGELAKLASKLIKQPPINISFQEMEFKNEFDGIWSSASLLHTPSTEIDDDLMRMTKALKQYGILYASFKYGDKEYKKGGRYFNCFDEFSITALIKKPQELTLLKKWVTNDQRPDRSDELWLNLLIKNI